MLTAKQELKQCPQNGHNAKQIAYQTAIIKDICSTIRFDNDEIAKQFGVDLGEEK